MPKKWKSEWKLRLNKFKYSSGHVPKWCWQQLLKGEFLIFLYLPLRTIFNWIRKAAGILYHMEHIYILYFIKLVDEYISSLLKSSLIPFLNV